MTKQRLSSRAHLR